MHKVVLEHTRRGVARGRRNASGALLEDRLDDRERLVVGHVERLNARRAGADLGVPSQQKRERERERERENDEEGGGDGGGRGGMHAGVEVMVQESAQVSQK